MLHYARIDRAVRRNFVGSVIRIRTLYPCTFKAHRKICIHKSRGRFCN